MRTVDGCFYLSSTWLYNLFFQCEQISAISSQVKKFHLIRNVLRLFLHQLRKHQEGKLFSKVVSLLTLCPQFAPLFIHTLKPLYAFVLYSGRTSYIKTPTNRASSVAYPFTFIKPCPMKGGMTLQDINRKILTQPKTSPVTPNLLRSAISGKLVVRRTRIRTGGKGCITITRTRG